jgi:hypothetical protein
VEFFNALLEEGKKKEKCMQEEIKRLYPLVVQGIFR